MTTEALHLIDDLNALKATRKVLSWEEIRLASRIQEIIKAQSSLDQQIDIIEDLLIKQRKADRKPWFNRLFERKGEHA